MNTNKLLNLKNIRKSEFFKDIFDIQSFVIVFTIFSLISIWSAEAVYVKSKKIKILNKELSNLKAEYISVKTELMSKSKRSFLVDKASSFGLTESTEPLAVIYLEK